MNPVSTASDARWTRCTTILLASLFVGRVGLLAISPLELVADEAYYWDWGRRPDWGYYSKPPLIAWLYAAIRMLGADSAFALRLPAVVLGTVTLVALGTLARNLGGPRVGFFTVLLLAATPGNVALNLLLTIDAPLTAMWALALLAAWRWLGPTGHGGWGVVYAGAVAVGVLAKQMMLVFPLLTALWLASDRERRHHLRAAGVWAGLLLPVMALLPTIWWNEAHGWITAKHTAHHFAAQSEFSVGGAIGRVIGFVLVQMVLISPPVAWAWGRSAWGILRGWTHSVREGDRFLWCFCAPPLIAITPLAFVRLPEPNWPATFWLAGAVLAARALVPATGPSLRNALRVGIGLAIFVTALPFIANLPAISGGKLDPTVRLKGWRSVATEIDQLRTEHADAETRPWPLIVGNRAYASALAFYLPDQPRVYHRPHRGSVQSQYQVWPDPAADGRIGTDAIIVLVRDDTLPHELIACFSDTRKVADFDIELGNGGHRTGTVWIGRDLQFWPTTPDT